MQAFRTLESYEGTSAPTIPTLPAARIERISPVVGDDARLEHLPVSSMDHAILAQTYPGRPMTTHHVLDTDAPFRRAELFAAVDALVRSVPPLRSVVRESAFGIARVARPLRWSPLETLVTFSDRPVEIDGSEWLTRPFDLSREEPFRILHSRRPGGGYQLLFTLHHGVTDGVGALALFDALLAHYAVCTGERASSPPALGPSGARLRRLLQRAGIRETLALALDNVRRVGRFTDRRASLLEHEEASASSLRCAVLDVPLADWARLKDRAHVLGATRNDLMLAAFLRAAARWRESEGMPAETFRALVPVDLRGELGIGPSLENHLGVIEADFTPADVASPRLLDAVSSRVRAQAKSSRALATPVALAMLTLLPPSALRRFFRWLDERPSSFMYSFLFSHIRVPKRLEAPPSVRAHRLYCLSALPRQPGLGLTITAMPDTVTITLAYTPPRLSERGAERLLAHFRDALVIA